MTAPSWTCDQMSFEGFGSATSSAESGAGVSPSESPNGLTTGRSGPVAARASHSLERAREAATLMRATSGPTSSGSSASAALQSLLENRLRAGLDGCGSPLYALTWKHWAMPWGQPICAQRASGHRTSGNDCTGLPLAGWPTPDTGREESVESFASRLERMKARHPTKGGMGSTGPLHIAAQLAGWATPTSRDYRSESASAEFNRRRWGHTRGKPLAAEVVGEHGPTSSGSPAATAKLGQLNPAFSRWLQAYPKAWCEAAIRAHRLMRMRRRKRA